MTEAPRNLLEEISTHWSQIRLARDGSTTSATAARNGLVLRYKDAIWWYVRAIARADDEVTHDIVQQVFVQILRGKCQHAGERPGRFRDYLKAVIRNEVRRYFRQQKRHAAQPLHLIPEQAVENDDGAFEIEEIEMWRRKLLDRAFGALEDFQRTHRDNAYHMLLSLRRAHPHDTNAQLADRLFEHTGTALPNGALLARLMRARQKLAELLLVEIADTLEEPTPERVADELVTLGLADYVGDYLPSVQRSIEQVGIHTPGPPHPNPLPPRRGERAR